MPDTAQRPNLDRRVIINPYRFPKTYTLEKSWEDGSISYAFASNNYDCFSSAFTVGAYAITKVSVELLEFAGNPTGPIKCWIYSQSAGNETHTNNEPDDRILEADNTIEAGDLTGSAAWYDFFFTGMAVQTSGHILHVVLRHEDGDNTDRIAWLYDSTITTDHGFERRNATGDPNATNDESNWVNVDLNAGGNCRIYSSP